MWHGSVVWPQLIDLLLLCKNHVEATDIYCHTDSLSTSLHSQWMCAFNVSYSFEKKKTIHTMNRVKMKLTENVDKYPDKFDNTTIMSKYRHNTNNIGNSFGHDNCQILSVLNVACSWLLQLSLEQAKLILPISGLNDCTSSCVLHIELFGSFLSSSCPYCPH